MNDNNTTEREYRERAVLIALQLPDRPDTGPLLRELSELAETAGAEVVGIMTQDRDRPEPGTYFGSGKIEELREMVVSASILRIPLYV